MAQDGIGGVRPGQPPASAPLPQGDIALTNAQALGTKLRSGEIVSARVGPDLGGGNVTLTVRGQTVVANSQMPLQPDTIVRLMVQSAGDQPVLRVLGSPLADLARLSTPAARAAALGLTATPLVGVVLGAFEDAGAPLDPARLRDAVAQLQRTPAGEIPQRAQALALLAQAGLPTTPPFVALAQRSAAGVLPNPAAAVTELQRAALAVQASAPASGPAAGSPLTTAANANTTPAVVPRGDQGAAPSAASVTPAATATAATTAATTATTTASATTALVTRSTEAVSVSTPSTVVTPTSPGGGQPTAAGNRVPVAGGQTAGGQAATSQASLLTGQVPQVAGQTAQSGVAPTGGTSSSAATAPAPVSTGTTIPPTTSGAPTLSLTVTTVAPSPAAVSSAAPTTTASLPLAVGAPVPASAGPATTLVVPTTPTTNTLAGTIVPDLARGGATAVLQALALAGVRPRDVGELPVATSAPTLLHRLDVPVEESGPIRASVDTDARQPPHTPLDAAVVQVMREQAAETVVKPQALVDYDVVLGLPLQIQGQPLPARLAVAERQTSGGRATFLRVDAELTHLGPLSVRISGIENGPMAITVLASGPALSALADALPDLTESLRALGLTAGVRIADLAEDLAHG